MTDDELRDQLVLTVAHEIAWPEVVPSVTEWQVAERAVVAIFPLLLARDARKLWDEQEIREDEAGAWMSTVEQLQAEVTRLRGSEERRLAMLQLHRGFAEGSAPMHCSGGCGAWPCPTYLACYPEEAWRTGEVR